MRRNSLWFESKFAIVFPPQKVFAMKVFGLVKAGDSSQACAFGFEALFDFGIIFNLNEIRRHVFLPLWTVQCSSFAK